MSLSTLYVRSAIGVNLLKRGMIHVGAMNWVINEKTMTAAQQYSHA